MGYFPARTAREKQEMYTILAEILAFVPEEKRLAARGTHPRLLVTARNQARGVNLHGSPPNLSEKR